MTQWDELVSILQKPTTPETMRQAASKLGGMSLSPQSKIVFCTLGNHLKYPNAIALEELPQHIATNPDFYELFKKLVLKGVR